jgi:hypothetical protein
MQIKNKMLPLFTPRTHIRAAAGIFPPIFSPAQDGGKWYTLLPASSSCGKNPGTQQTEGWVDPTAGLDVLEILEININDKE